ncbi:beta-galactosidase [Chitinophagaceae bacterium LB-8]|uniref:beta-galactosidase n=1 Tax=Paraflavisolibacter caeni TaxID=2982496 RepID=A0A9X3B9Y3_9BACT|nr:sugar-binding domain-containing protein [Paraflavisolibacter caeni]MCU7552650.1 beta-galactosidase [Paraflavisolibacter caeni]
MNKTFSLAVALLLKLAFCNSIVSAQTNSIDLSGTWFFQVDSLDKGVQEQWYNKKLDDKISLPGSMTTNGKGNDITVNTPWTGQIVDSSWFFKSEYAQYREPGNIKVPFWLQPVKYYKGAAWYQKNVSIPDNWKGKHLELFIERSHWETTVWVDDQQIGMDNSLGTPHVFNLTHVLSPGTHRITVRVDNRVKDFNVGQNSHSISDHTQSNWNGMVGKLSITARPALFIDDVQLYPDIHKKQVTARIKLNNEAGRDNKAEIQLFAKSNKANADGLKPLAKSIELQKGDNMVEVIYPMGNQPLLWDEFHPDLYTLSVKVKGGKETDERVISFGMRDFATQGTQFTINGQLTFLRGTLECAIFPKTGYPPTDVESWMHIFKVARSYGLNHMRFHSWCPPEAAFDAADRSGFYLHVEASSWANQGSSVGDGKPVDQYIYEESERMVKTFGNHPSFCMMAYGNEPAGKNHTKYLTEFVSYWKKRDSRRLYTTAAGWPVVPENDYNSTPDPRIQAWGQGLKSIINGQSSKSNYDWRDIISKWQHPTVSHEIGQWCVYPDFKEIKKYTGVLKAKNFEIFQQKLKDNGLDNLADSFLLASGKLQALCYKADIEAALRTPGFGGFQLLDLHDFPGQGTALVGVLNPFWEDKGYITGKEYSRFCNATVPLARLPKMVYLNNEELSVPVEVAHFGEKVLNNITPTWNIKNVSGKVLFSGQLPSANIPLGNCHQLGEIKQSLASIDQPSKLSLTIAVGDHQNSWDLFVYPATLPDIDKNIVVTQQLDEQAIQTLNKGGKVLLTLKKGSLKPEKGGDVLIGFSSIFWNTAWTGGQAPNTLGILCNPKHPAFSAFPTEYYSNWQWWDAMSNSNAIRMDSVAIGMQPIIRVIDDWVTANSLGLVFECRVGAGKLIVSGIDLVANLDKRPEARQLLYSLKRYMATPEFAPKIQVGVERIKGLSKEQFFSAAK